MNYSIVIPVYNEESSLQKLFKQLKLLDNDIEIIIVNDGSTDQTNSILKEEKNYYLINNSTNKGKGFSIIKGIRKANNKNIILMDGDLEIDLKCIPKLIKVFEEKENHVVVGNRWINNLSENKNINTYGNYFFNFLFNQLYGTKLNDVLCCAKIINKKILNQLNLNSSGFSIEIEIMSKLAKKNIDIKEIEVTYNRRTKNEGKKLKISDGWEILWKMFYVKIS